MPDAATSRLRRALDAEKARRRPPLTTMINVRFYATLHEWLAATAATEGVSINGLVLAIIEDARTEGEGGR